MMFRSCNHYFYCICMQQCCGSGYNSAKIHIIMVTWLHIGISIRIKLKSGSRSASGSASKFISWIWIRINLHMSSQNVWNMSLFEHFSKGFILFLKPGSGSKSASGWKVGSGSTSRFTSGSASSKNLYQNPHQGDQSNSDPQQSDADPQHNRLPQSETI